MASSAIRSIALSVALLASLSAPASADAIDGNWCLTEEARHFSISGPSITTPAGTRATGNYSRHAFFYTVPDGDPGAGDEIAMQLLNDQEVAVSVNKGAVTVWRRCEITS